MARLGVRASASAQRVYELGKVSRAGFRWENTFGLLKPDGDGRGRVGGLDETRYLWKLGESPMAEKATWPRRWPFSSAQNPGDSFRGRASHEVESRTTSATVTEASVCFDIGAVPVRHALPGLELPHHVERRAGAAPVSPSRSTCCDRDSGHGQVGIDPGRLLLGIRGELRLGESGERPCGTSSGARMLLPDQLHRPVHDLRDPDKLEILSRSRRPGL